MVPTLKYFNVCQHQNNDEQANIFAQISAPIPNEKISPVAKCRSSRNEKAAEGQLGPGSLGGRDSYLLVYHNISAAGSVGLVFSISQAALSPGLRPSADW